MVAPGGVGKSSLTICEGLAMASGRELLGDWTATDLKVWLYHLEDPRDEMDRRISGAMQHYNVTPQEISGRLFVDTGRERELTVARVHALRLPSIHRGRSAIVLAPLFEAAL